MQSERADKSMGVIHEDEVVLRSRELAIELAETRHLLWLAIEKMEPSMRVTVTRADLPADYDLEIFEPEQSPGTVIITASRKAT